MNVVKITTSDVLKKEMDIRTKELGVSNPEYIRTLVNLEVAIQKYQRLTIYINELYNAILEYQKMLDIQCTPLLEVPMIDLSKIDTNADN